MRKTMISLLLAAAGTIGLAGSTAVTARDVDARIYVGVGDVMFSYGRPYYRHTREPLFVVYERGYPRYYRIGPRYYPPRYGYRVRWYDDDDDYYRYRYRYQHDPYRYDWRYRHHYYDPYWDR